MLYVIDRIVSGIAVCESLESDAKLEIDMQVLPKGANEGDVIKRVGDCYVVDSGATTQRKAEMSDRLNRLFRRNNPQ